MRRLTLSTANGFVRAWLKLIRGSMLCFPGLSPMLPNPKEVHLRLLHHARVKSSRRPPGGRLSEQRANKKINETSPSRVRRTYTGLSLVYIGCEIGAARNRPILPAGRLIAISRMVEPGKGWSGRAARRRRARAAGDRRPGDDVGSRLGSKRVDRWRKCLIGRCLSRREHRFARSVTPLELVDCASRACAHDLSERSSRSRQTHAGAIFASAVRADTGFVIRGSPAPLHCPRESGGWQPWQPWGCFGGRVS
jgi:hypothetical protein